MGFLMMTDNLLKHDHESMLRKSPIRGNHMASWRSISALGGAPPVREKFVVWLDTSKMWGKHRVNHPGKISVFLAACHNSSLLGGWLGPSFEQPTCTREIVPRNHWPIDLQFSQCSSNAQKSMKPGLYFHPPYVQRFKYLLCGIFSTHPKENLWYFPRCPKCQKNLSSSQSAQRSLPGPRNWTAAGVVQCSPPR